MIAVMLLAPLLLAWFLSAVFGDYLDYVMREQKASALMKDAVKTENPTIVPVFVGFFCIRNFRLRYRAWVVDHRYYYKGKQVNILGQSVEVNP